MISLRPLASDIPAELFSKEEDLNEELLTTLQYLP